MYVNIFKGTQLNDRKKSIAFKSTEGKKKENCIDWTEHRGVNRSHK